uniref:Uncharacterized protein n=1 Tax=Romanomermis culicivorax TaxID=13658 RepID=A0A915JCJ5_ROMCU
MAGVIGGAHTHPTGIGTHRRSVTEVAAVARTRRRAVATLSLVVDESNYIQGVSRKKMHIVMSLQSQSPEIPSLCLCISRNFQDVDDNDYILEHFQRICLISEDTHVYEYRMYKTDEGT